MSELVIGSKLILGGVDCGTPAIQNDTMLVDTIPNGVGSGEKTSTLYIATDTITSMNKTQIFVPGAK